MELINPIFHHPNDLWLQYTSLTFKSVRVSPALAQRLMISAIALWLSFHIAVTSSLPIIKKREGWTENCRKRNIKMA